MIEPICTTKPLRAALAAVVVLASLCLGGPAEANGRGGPATASPFLSIASAAAAGAVWRSGSDLVAEAARWVGAGKFTRSPGPWCADAVSFWLQRVGKPPLANRMAASALSYGPRVANPRPGDLVVMATRRGAAGHVGIVAGVAGDGSVEIISGNWGRRVARAIVPRAMVTAFVEVR